ncbi:MAG TPA: NAD(P)-dependent oxidoreductase [Candidatus Binatia bacterium]|jgi:nucleoside-diphosphate-sugar epimerase|nr:NAD(P)-dependent oxidoreductase [Candidatus Binatia bacterium]
MTGSILVTGSSGFIGAALGKRLGERMLPCDLSIDRPIAAIVRSPAFNSVETVVHCAAVQLFTPGYDLYRYETFHRMNVEALEILLERCQEVGVRKFIHISTDMVYGVPTVCPIPEVCPLQPVGFYGYSKQLAEEAVLRYVFRIPVITLLRPRIIGGPGRAGLFGTLARAIQMGLPIPVFGDGHNPFQMLHIDDFVDLIMECIERDVPGIFNAGSQHVTTLRAKLLVIGAVLGRRPHLVCLPEPLAISVCQALYGLRFGLLHPEQFLTAGRSFVLSLDKTYAHFDWRPLHSDDEIVGDTVRSSIDKISKDKPAPSGHADGSNETYPLLPPAAHPSP